MKLQVPFLRKKAPRSPSTDSLRHAFSLPAGSASSSSRSHAGPPSPCCGKSSGRTDQKASPTSKHAKSIPCSKSLSSFEVRELQDAFKVFDANHDGKISVEELGSVLQSLGDNCSKEELLQMVKEVDRDGDGFINLEEFMILHSASEGNKVNCDKELRDAFRLFDADKNGFISVEELHGVLKRLRRKCSVEDCRKMIRGVDKDGDGQVSFEEFRKMMA